MSKAVITVRLNEVQAEQLEAYASEKKTNLADAIRLGLFDYLNSRETREEAAKKQAELLEVNKAILEGLGQIYHIGKTNQSFCVQIVQRLSFGDKGGK